MMNGRLYPTPHYNLSLQTGDVTGDGHPDILIADPSNGSGGCAFYRVLASEGRHIRQIFYRAHCEGEITFDGGLVHIDGAVWPRGCTAAHGCGSYTKLLRWTGSDWATVSKHVTID